MDRGRGEQSSSSQSRPYQNFLDEAARGEAQAIVNVLHLSQNTMSDMESGQSFDRKTAKFKVNICSQWSVLWMWGQTEPLFQRRVVQNTSA